MLTGAIAASYYGVPRTTSDADVVVDISEEGSQTKLVLALKKAGLKRTGLMQLSGRVSG